MPLLLLSKPNPLALGFGLALGKPFGSKSIFCAVVHVTASVISLAATFFQKVIAHSFRRSSAPNRTYCAGLQFAAA